MGRASITSGKRQSGNASRRTLVPWGRLGRQPTIQKGAVKRGFQGVGNSAPALAGMSYPANQPAFWPVVGQKLRSPTAPTEAGAAKANSIVQKAWDRQAAGSGPWPTRT